MTNENSLNTWAAKVFFLLNQVHFLMQYKKRDVAQVSIHTQLKAGGVLVHTVCGPAVEKQEHVTKILHSSS